MSLCQIRLPVCNRNTTIAPWSSTWASPRIVPVTSGAFALTDSVSACQRSGDAKFSVVGARRGESASPFNCPRSTRAPDPSTREDHGFTRRQRLTRGADLQATTRDGKRIRTAFLDVRVVLTPRQHSRVGFVVPKHGRSAVRRNRLKRSLRELTRLTILGALRASEAGSGMDIVMRALPAAYAASFETLRAEVESLRARLARLGAAPQDRSAAP